MIKQKSGFARAAVISVAAAIAFGCAPASAQDTAPKQGEQKQSGEPGKDNQKRIDEMAEAARLLKGPAGNSECVWIGRRIVGLLWRDDLDTAARHWALYDRFSCPVEHIQSAFRCVVRQGDIDAKQQESLMGRVHACWVNPDLPPSPPASAQANSEGKQGTGNP